MENKMFFRKLLCRVTAQIVVRDKEDVFVRQFLHNTYCEEIAEQRHLLYPGQQSGPLRGKAASGKTFYFP